MNPGGSGVASAWVHAAQMQWSTQPSCRTQHILHTSVAGSFECGYSTVGLRMPWFACCRHLSFQFVHFGLWSEALLQVTYVTLKASRCMHSSIYTKLAYVAT